MERIEREYGFAFVSTALARNPLIVGGSRAFAAPSSRDICSFVERRCKFRFGCYIARTIVGRIGGARVGGTNGIAA